MSQVAIHSARPAPLGALLNPAGMIANLWAHRELTAQFAMRNFRQRHRGTYLGALWAVIFPLVLLSVYTFIFNFVFEARFGVTPSETRFQYAVLLFAGITTFGIFSETVTSSCGLVLENPAYVKRVVFPLEVLPLARLYSSVMFGAIGYALTLAGAAWQFGTLHWTVLLLPLVLLPMLTLALGLAWFLASLSVFVRDIGNVTVIVVSQLLFFLTPNFYRAENLKDPFWQDVVQLNPLAHVVEGVRRVLVGQQPEWASLAIGLTAGLFAMQFGYTWFMKSKRGFADVL